MEGRMSSRNASAGLKTHRAAMACLVLTLMSPIFALADTGLDGCLYWLDGTSQKWTSDEWKQQVAHMSKAGLRHVIIVGPAVQEKEETPGPMTLAADRFLAACEGTDLRVYISLWSHPLWYGRWDLKEELTTNQHAVERLAARYGKHLNFAGWYIPHEIYVVWGEQAKYIADLYGGLSKICKQATPNAKVILSPFFILDREGYLGSFRFAEPLEYETFWFELLRQTQIDVVALQDSGEHLSFYNLDDRRPFMAAMKRACARANKTPWINIETGELHVETFADYEKKFGRKTSVNDAKTQGHWRVVPPDKLRKKVALAREFAETTITWGYREYWDPMRGPDARKAYEAYLQAATAESAPIKSPTPAVAKPCPRFP
jgi:hypothetical protein